eukprot:8578343-Karenia_brevis.AAC.1
MVSCTGTWLRSACKYDKFQLVHNCSHYIALDQIGHDWIGLMLWAGLGSLHRTCFMWTEPHCNGLRCTGILLISVSNAAR